MDKSIYRSRLSEKTDDFALKFMSSISDDDWIFEEDIKNTEAHDIMLYEQGIISLNELKEVLQTLEEIKIKFKKGKFPISNFLEDVHESVEHYITSKIGMEIGGKIHTGRSRNDQVATDVRMKVRSELFDVLEAIIKLVEVLIVLASKNIETIMVLYTHTQQAQIGCFAQYPISYIDHLFRDIERLLDCYNRVNLNPLGASAIGGSSFKLNRLRTTELLGFNGLVENSIDAISSRDFALETAAVLSILMSNMSRISEDIILWSTSEFNYVELSDEYTSTSSVMPQKKNPCSLELIRARTSKVFCNFFDLLTIIKALPTGYSRDLQETKRPLRVSFEIIIDSLEMLSRIFNTIIIKKESMQKIASESYAMALDLADELVNQGLSFREAHKLVGGIVKILAESNRKLTEINSELLERLSTKILKKKISIKNDNLKKILDPKYSLIHRSTTGSANPKEVQRMINYRRKRLNFFKKEFQKRKEYVNISKKLLSKTIRDILS